MEQQKKPKMKKTLEEGGNLAHGSKQVCYNEELMWQISASGSEWVSELVTENATYLLIGDQSAQAMYVIEFTQTQPPIHMLCPSSKKYPQPQP